MSDPQLEHLNDAERRVLRLLAEGHTIKSAASLIGATPAALNERLREARRKAGVGSSRELARELKAHESRDDLFGVEDEGNVLPFLRPSGAAHWRLAMGVVAMSAIGLAILAGAITLSSQSAAVPESDPLIGSALPDQPTPSQWQARLKAERRDDDWAKRTEKALRSRYEQIALIGGSDKALRVSCGATLCEVAGVIGAQQSAGDDPGNRDSVSEAVRRLQDRPLIDDLAALGLKFESTLFTATATEPKRTAFFSYFTRNDT